jgi:type IV secretory pathway VirJ component
VVPVKALPSPWLPFPFALQGRRTATLSPLEALLKRAELQTVGIPDAPAPGAGLVAAVKWLTAPVATAASLPEDIADLPLIEVAAQSAPVNRIAIIITGDGGWAGLDRGVADALTADGVRVIGFSTLKFFWHKQTPDAAAQAIARVIAHYGKTDPQTSFVLIGYSFGASLVPVVANRLPDDARQRVDGGVMISPDDEAVFEIHVGDWFGSTHHGEALPIGPEMQASKVPLVCVHGADENDSYCLKPQPAHVRVVTLPGGHHYNGDYGALGTLIVNNLPRAVLVQ